MDWEFQTLWDVLKRLSAKNGTAELARTEQPKTSARDRGVQPKNGKKEVIELDDTETPIQEPGLRKKMAPNVKTNPQKKKERAQSTGQSEDDQLIETYYKLRKELEELKGKNIASKE